MIDESSLDRLLAESMPATTHSPDCLGCRTAQSRPVRTRRGPRTAVVALVGGLCIGAGATAAAAGVPASVFGSNDVASVSQPVSGGDTCLNSYRVVPAPGGGAAAVAAAEELIAKIDFSALDLTDELRSARTGGRSQWAPGPGEATPSGEPEFTDSFYETAAQGMAVSEIVKSGLVEQGFDAYAVTVQVATTCGESLYK